MAHAVAADLVEQRAPEVRASLEGALLYQVCSDRVCHPPGRLPLRFEVTIRPWTR